MRHPLRSRVVAVVFSSFALGAGLARAGDAVPVAEPSAPIARGLVDLRIGAGIASDEVILFPLYASSEAPATGVSAGVRGASLLFSEPEPASGRQVVRVANGGSTAALVLAGTVVEGGRRDRMVRFDRLIPAEGAVEVEVVPASMARDARPQAAAFRVADFLAPSYLRESGQFSTDVSAVPRFVSHFLEFRNPSDTRASLLAIGGSDALADYCLTCRRSFAEWPTKRGAGAAVGGVLVVRGRVQSMEVFADNEHLKAFLEPMLKSLAFPAAAITLRAKALGIPLPGMDDPAGTLAAATKAAHELLVSLGTATYARRKTDAAFVGEAWTLKLRDGARGSALVREGRLMHAAVYPGDPFEDALYAKALSPLDPEDAATGPVGEAGDAGRAELERRAAQGSRLTAAEQRLLDRMRERRPGER